MRDKVDTLALVFGSLGFICLAYSILLPRWYVAGSERKFYWVGPWMHCTERWCEVIGDILLGMYIPLWIGTALALSAVLISGLAMRDTSCCGNNCCGTNCCGTNCCGDNVQKKLFRAGCLYLISCLVTLGPIIWATTILSPIPRNMGECFYLAWVSLGFLMAAGVLQLHRYSPCRRKEEVSHNCTTLEHESEEERCGEDSIHFLPPETMCERGQLEMVRLKNKYERTAGDSITETIRKDSKRQYI